MSPEQKCSVISMRREYLLSVCGSRFHFREGVFKVEVFNFDGL